MPKLVRLKPYDKRKGHLTRRYTVFSIKFDESRGWYKVDDEVANYLATLHQRNGDENSPMLFDVCSEAEAIDLEQVEADKKKVEERAKPTEARPVSAAEAGAVPGVLTTADIAPPKPAQAAALKPSPPAPAKNKSKK